METISLQSYNLPDKNSFLTNRQYYSLFLNQRHFYFKSKRAANRLIKELNELLTLYYYDLNEIYAQLFQTWRHYYMLDRNIDILKDITSINYWFRRLNFRTENYNTLLFNYFHNIINEIIACYNLLRQKAVQSNQWVSKNEIDSKLFQLKNIKNKLSNFPDLEIISKCYIHYEGPV